MALTSGFKIMNERENLLEPEVEICKSMESFLESAHSIAKTEEKTKNYSYFTIFSNKYMALRYAKGRKMVIYVSFEQNHE